MKKILIFVILLLSTLLIHDKNSFGSTERISKIKVTASFYPLYFFASQIGGNQVEVINLTPPNVDLHEYDLTAKDVAQIQDSKILILNGVVEPWVSKIKEMIDPNRTWILWVAQGLMTQSVMLDGKGTMDPHVWLSPPLAKQIVNRIEHAFVQVDPTHKEYYSENAQKLDMQLDELDRSFRQGFSHCSKKFFVTSHTSFGYLAETYHLKQVPIAGLSPDSEPSPKQIAQIVDFCRKNGMKVIFSEKLISPKLSQTIANEIGAQVLVLNPMESLTVSEINQGKNYFTVMQENLKNLKISLECTP